ncbi:MAG: hypothetical protein ACFFBD_06220 [Candidatus Hodarchaeota archaeon]
MNVIDFLLLLVPSIAISDSPLRFVIFISYAIWAIASIYFLFAGFQNLIFWGERKVRPIPKTTNILLNTGLILLINVVSLSIIALLGLLYGEPLDIKVLASTGIIPIYFILLIVLNIFTFFFVVKFWFKDKIKAIFIPVFFLFFFVYLIFVIIKAFSVDTEGALLGQFSVISNLCIILFFLFLGLRRMAQLIGPLGEEQYEKRFNPRAVNLLLFHLTAVYLAVIELDKILRIIVHDLVSFFSTALVGDFNVLLDYLFSVGPNWILFVLFGPLGYALFFLTSSFSESPDFEDSDLETPITGNSDSN